MDTEKLSEASGPIREARISWNPHDHYKNVQVAEKYDKVRFSSISGKIFNHLEKSRVRRIFSEIPENSLILDAPCGTGRFSEVLLDLGHRVVGLDISPAMLEVAKRKLSRFGTRFEAREQDVRTLKPGEDAFDAALCARVLMHFPLDEQAIFLASVASVTRGTVVFNQSLNSRYGVFRRQIKKLLGNQPPSAYPVTWQESETLVAAAGLKCSKRKLLLPFISEAAFFVCTG